MTATTPSPFGNINDQHPAPYYRMTIFTWDADLFHSVCKLLKIDHEAIEDDEYPYYSIYKFTCDTASLLFLVQRYLSARRPFGLDDFNLKE